MNTGQYLAFIPLLIFGIGISDLLGQWKRFFIREDQFVLYIVLTVMFIEMAIYNVFIYVSIFDLMPGYTYIRYLSFLLPPVLFQMLVNVFTPDEGRQTREYFDQNIRLIFVLLALFVASHFIYDFQEPHLAQYIRILYIILMIGVAVTRKKWLIYLGIFFWIVGLFFRAFTMAGQ